MDFLYQTDLFRYYFHVDLVQKIHFGYYFLIALQTVTVITKLPKSCKI